MNILSNIDDYAGKSVVPVLCGDSVQGTGFFVSAKHIITANHVIAEHIAFPSVPIQIKVGDLYIICTCVINGVEPDYAILECKDYECPDEYILELVGGSFRKDQRCVVIGYPIELGNGQDYYAVEIKNVRKKQDLKGGFDRLVVRTDSFGFSSYCGFSGSPVINKAGKVIGVQTDQLFNTLGYASIESFADEIETTIDITIDCDDALYDDTTYGLGTAKRHTEKQFEKSQYRFKKNLHVRMSYEEATIESFCGYGFDERAEKIYDQFCKWYTKLPFKYLQLVSSKKHCVEYLKCGIITNDFRKEIYELLDLQKEKSYVIDRALRYELANIYNGLSDHAMLRRLFTDYQFLCLNGSAGTGKSHLLYREAIKIASKTHIYLFQGMEFKDGELPLNTMFNILNWKDENPIMELNNNLEKDNRYAIFIIDAINEGVGRSFWKETLPLLKEKILAFPRIKLLVSIRTMSDDDHLKKMFDGDWRRISLKGFTNVERAFAEYFSSYEIKDNYTQYLKIEEFRNPLFMKIFCETYRHLSDEERRKALRLPIYKKYLKQRNVDVSGIVDEDPTQNVTSKLVLWVANQSIMQYSCGNVPRQPVYKRASRISMFRPWSKSLLYGCLKTCVLKEYTSSIDGQDYIDFEYESLGDYLKAGCLSDRNMSEVDKLNLLLKYYKILDIKTTPEVLKLKIYSFLRAFLSIWNPSPSVWENKAFQKGCLTSILLSSLHYRNVKDDENTLMSAHIESILQNNPSYREPELILKNFSLYSKGLFQPIHEYLLLLKMCDRDLIWSTKVNALYDWAQYKELIDKIKPVSSIEFKTLLLIETWMLTTSYPYIRYYIMRKLQDILTKHPEHINYLIEEFHSVDDNYILIGLYSAIYGSLTSLKDTELIVSIGENLYNHHFNNQKSPVDIMVRHWTLKIFEYINHLVPDNTLWSQAQPPYIATVNLFDIVGDNDFDKDDYFGETIGSKRINHSLYHWDFSRYIIGTNSSSHSREFYLSEKEPVSLKFIENAIAYLIKAKYCWNDKLGEYDASVPYQTRHDNTVERIGKKYQWLALNEVYAYLCDVCKVKVNIWCNNEHFAEINYPWYVEEKGYYDPVLPAENIAQKESYNLFDVIIPESTLSFNEASFVEHGMEHTPLYITIKDKDKEEWVVLVAHSTMEETDGETTRERFVYYNPIIVENARIDEFKEWMSKENFYGRWMPEHTGSTDFRWNEYPWADSYRALDVKDDETFYEEGHPFKSPYYAQLQESAEGYPEEHDYLSTAYMPSADMMKKMNWHTAERGIIRNSTHKIVAINRCMQGDPMKALYVKKSEIDSYLELTNSSLFYALLGENVTRVGYHHKDMVRLTGAAMYTTVNGVEIIQPLRKEPEVENNDTFTHEDVDKLSEFLPKNVLQGLLNKKKSEILKALSEMHKSEDPNKTSI